VRRLFVELLHVAAGLAAALAIAATASWAYPLAARDIWIVTLVAMGVTVLMSIGQIRQAWEADRAGRGPQ
jgi:hypothetical protein